jgi:uncharacterized tellurite resistance protein B-like protein
MDTLIGFFVLFLLLGGMKVIVMLMNSPSSSRGAPSTSGETHNTALQLTDGYEPQRGLPFKQVHFKGRIPVKTPTKVTFVISAVDINGQRAHPCFFPLDACQEKKTLAFQQRVNLDRVFSPGDYVQNWIRIGVVFPSLLQPPYGGNRTIQIVLRLFEKGAEVGVHSGCCKSDTPGLLWSGARNFTFTYKERGYIEVKQNLREAAILAIPLAMAVSSADGCFDEEEGEIVQAWIERHVNSAQPNDRENLKRDMNAAVEKAYQDGITTGIQTSQPIARLKEIGDKATNFEALELCFEVMSANDKMSPEEMALLRSYADLLNIPKKEFERLMDIHALNISTDGVANSDDERLLGLEASMDPREKLLALRKEFKKWNSRMATLTDPDHRQVAQHRLDMIGRLRQKYEFEDSTRSTGSLSP